MRDRLCRAHAKKKEKNMRKARALIIPLITAALLLISCLIIFAQDTSGETVSVTYYDGNRKVETVSARVGSAPKSTGVYYYYSDGLYLASATKYYSDAAMTKELTSISADTVNIYGKATAGGSMPKYAVFSGTPSVETLISFSADSAEIYDAVMASSTRVVETYADTTMTVPKAIPTLSTDTTIDLKGNELRLTGAETNYGINPADGVTFAIKNGTLSSAKAHLAFPYNTNPHLVYENLTVNYSGGNMMDHRGGGTLTARNTVFNVTGSRGFFLLNKTAGRTLDASFTDCTFNVPATAKLSVGVIHTATESVSTGTLNVVTEGCIFNIALSSVPAFEQVGAATLNVTVKGSDTRPSRFTQGCFVYRRSGTGNASVSIADGTLFQSTPTYSGVTPTYQSGTRLAHSAGEGENSCVVTSSYVTVNKVTDGVTTQDYYETGYSKQIETSFGHRAKEKDGTVGAVRTMIGWIDQSGNPITLFTPTNGATITAYSGDTEEWASWVILSADQKNVIDSSLNTSYAEADVFPTEWYKKIPQGGVVRLFSDVTTVDSLVSLPEGTLLDLNGHKLSFTNGRFGYSTTGYGSTPVVIKNGAIDTSASKNQNILYTTAGFKGSVKFIDVDLKIQNGSAFNFRGGSLYMENCSFDNSGAIFLQLGNRYTQGCPIDVTVKNTDVVAAAFISANGTSDGSGYSTVASVDADGISFNGTKLITATASIKPDASFSLSFRDCEINATLLYELGVDFVLNVELASCRLSQDPEVSTTTYAPDKITFADGQDIFEAKDPVYRYEVKVPVMLDWNLTLDTSVTVNFYLGKKGIDSLTVNGKKYELSELQESADGRYLVSLNAVPANMAMESIDIKIGYGGEYTLELTKSLADYAEALFASNATFTAKQLVASVSKYVDAAYAYARSLDENAPEAPEALTKLLASEDYAKYALTDELSFTGSCDIGNAYLAIESAQIDLSTELKYKLNLNPTYSGTLTINGAHFTVKNGRNAGGDVPYIKIKVDAYSLYSEDLIIGGICDDGRVISGKYCLATYANGVKGNASDAALAAINALGAYVKVAVDYRTEYEDTKGYTASAEIVNKGGADATVSYVIDDGTPSTGLKAYELMQKYDYLQLSFAMITRKLVTLKTTTDENGNTVYEMTEDGKYIYTVNEEAYATWKKIMSLGRSELANHSHTHAYWGLDDAGGKTTYVDNNGNIKTSTQPVGSSSKELYAPIQILTELFPPEQYPLMKLVTFINPGISVPMTDTKASDGKTYTSYYNYFKQLLLNAIDDGTLIGVRNTFQVSNTTGSVSKVVLPSSLTNKANRLGTPAYMILDKNKGNGIENWTAYIDHAIEQGGWACFCIHEIYDTAPSGGHYILTADADALFGYTADKSVWVATYTEAMTYYCQWSTAEVSSEYRGGKVLVTLTDREDDELFNMAMTVKVSVPPTWSTASHNGTALTVYENEDGTHYVLVDLVPDQGTAEITKGN